MKAVFTIDGVTEGSESMEITQEDAFVTTLELDMCKAEEGITAKIGLDKDGVADLIKVLKILHEDMEA